MKNLKNKIMKNIHVLPTDKPSRLYKTGDFLLLDSKAIPNNALETKNQHIYITSDEEIKIGDWYLSIDNFVRKADVIWDNVYGKCPNKKIILTTDQDLIKDGVQAIDDEFLEWFVKNPNCEEVEIRKEYITPLGDIVETCYDNERLNYKIIIPKEEPKQDLPIVNGSYGCTIQTKKQEPKQETLEEAIDRISKEDGYDIEGGKVADFVDGMVKGAKWQQEKSYSEEKIDKILQKLEEIKIMINIR